MHSTSLTFLHCELPMNAPTPNLLISDRALRHIQDVFACESGIRIPSTRQDLIVSRLHKRVVQLGLPDFDSYCELIARDQAPQERARMVDLLTTHETYFFREPKHFEHLGSKALSGLRGNPVRVWCAAASTGEEAYSAAMTLDTAIGHDGWSVHATDISENTIAIGQQGLYRMERLQFMPTQSLKKYCLRGKDDFAGSMLMTRHLRDRVSFVQHNLLEPATALGKFNVIFLRNVLIYFDQPTRQKIVSNVVESLNPGGWLYIGHADSLQGLSAPLECVQPSIYRKHVPAPGAKANGKARHGHQR